MSLIALLIAANAIATNGSDPLANAERGQLQCYHPDVEHKTCQSMASYQRTGPGSYDNKAVLPVTEGLTLELHEPVVIKGDAVCGFLRKENILAGTLWFNGQRVDTEKAGPLLERIVQGMAPTMMSSEICTRYETFGDDFTAKVSVGGVYRADQDETMKWINPGDGYTVAR